MTEISAGGIGRQNSDVSINQTQPAPEARPTGQLNDQTFQPNPAERRPPNVLQKAAKQLGDFIFSKLSDSKQNEYRAFASKKAMSRINVELPNPEGLERSGLKHADVKQRYDARIKLQVEQMIDPRHSRKADEMDSFEHSMGNSLYIEMFGQEDHAVAEPFMSALNPQLMKNENREICGALNHFLSAGGSFKVIDTKKDCYFEYNPKTKTMDISADMLDPVNVDLFVQGLEQNLRVTHDYKILPGRINIAAYDNRMATNAALDAQVHMPNLDLANPAPELVTITQRTIFEGGSTVNVPHVDISPAFQNAPNYNAVLLHMDEAMGAGMLNMHSKPPTESELIHIAMFGSEKGQRNANYLDTILADPQLKTSLLTFLRDGGSFELEEGNHDSVRFAPAMNKIFVRKSGLSLNATALEAGLRHLFPVVTAAPPAATLGGGNGDTANVQNPPTMDTAPLTPAQPAETAVADTGADQAETTVADTEAEQAETAVETRPEPVTNTGADATGTAAARPLADLVQEVELQEEIELDTAIDMIRNDEDAPEAEYEELTPYERGRQNYLAAIDRLNNNK